MASPQLVDRAARYSQPCKLCGDRRIRLVGYCQWVQFRQITDEQFNDPAKGGAGLMTTVIDRR